ncbi:hypothetical protein [Actinophytocola xanthii]|nr:hypothetical protein [Actinophytocola xanthii]
MTSATRERFARDGYCPLHHIVVPPQLHTLSRYHRALAARGGMTFGDTQSSLRWVARDEPAACALQHQFTPLMAAIAGVPVEPAYTYTVRYEAGADLPRHVDRAECEYSVSIAVDFEPAPAGPTGWPLWLVTEEGPVPIDQHLGDGLFFRGRQLPHYRHPLPAGCRSTSILLHYVDTR